MKKIIGLFMAAIFFVVIFLIMALQDGFYYALITLFASLFASAFIFVAIYLICDEGKERIDKDKQHK